MVRALLESLAFRVALLYDCALRETGFSFTCIRVDGGVSKNDFICQTLADLTGIEVERGEVADSSALGAMYMAGLNCGIWSTKRQLTELRKVDKTFAPDGAQRAKRLKQMRAWERAVDRFKKWYMLEDIKNLD